MPNYPQPANAACGHMPKGAVAIMEMMANNITIVAFEVAAEGHPCRAVLHRSGYHRRYLPAAGRAGSLGAWANRHKNFVTGSSAMV